jgi:hypothetical protein
MSASPLVDAHVINTPNPWLHAEAARGIEIQLREEIGRLKEAEVEAKHRIRTLIEERDSARIQADHKWRLREEFEALLGTSDVETGVERVKEAQNGAARYEYIRKLNPREFAALSLFCITSGIHFDTAVDRRRKET